MLVIETLGKCFMCKVFFRFYVEMRSTTDSKFCHYVLNYSNSDSITDNVDGDVIVLLPL